MKKYITFLLITLFLSSCEEVINVELENTEPKLVIDAIIKWQKGTTGANQTIKLSLTNDFYTNDILPASGAVVKVLNSSGVSFDFIESSSNSGEYSCADFSPIINEIYTLSILYDGQLYNATNKLLATPEIINVTQQTVIGIGGEDEIEIKYFYQDNGLEDNYYLLKVLNPNKQIPEFGVVSDEFFQGNTMFGLYRSSETEPGISLGLSVQGISVGYYNYMNKLVTIAGSGSGNPFATPPATIRGNIVNQNNAENFPLGYFHLSEIDEVNYLVQ